MKFIKKLSLKSKLLSSFAFLIFLMLFLGFQGLTNSNKIADISEKINQSNVIPLQSLNKITSDINKERLALFKHISSFYSEEMEKLGNIMKGHQDHFLTNIDILKNYLNDEDQLIIDEIKMEYSEYSVISESILRKSNEFEKESAVEEINAESAELFKNIVSKLDLIIDNIDKNATLAYEESVDIKKSVSFTLLLFMGLGSILAVFFSLQVSKVITKPINELEKAANRVSQGDLDVYVKSETKDEVGRLAN
ncbi:MAG: MCP four helix bundle domain-containing protein, partial [Melioribacteraceae bacterium]|nr:MCP four helix bundle domain-containing protein [Melioribacteraceae bacterium]